MPRLTRSFGPVTDLLPIDRVFTDDGVGIASCAVPPPGRISTRELMRMLTNAPMSGTGQRTRPARIPGGRAYPIPPIRGRRKTTTTTPRKQPSPPPAPISPRRKTPLPKRDDTPPPSMPSPKRQTVAPPAVTAEVERLIEQHTATLAAKHATLASAFTATVAPPAVVIATPPPSSVIPYAAKEVAIAEVKRLWSSMDEAPPMSPSLLDMMDPEDAMMLVAVEYGAYMSNQQELAAANAALADDDDGFKVCEVIDQGIAPVDELTLLSPDHLHVLLVREVVFRIRLVSCAGMEDVADRRVFAAAIRSMFDRVCVIAEDIRAGKPADRPVGDGDVSIRDLDAEVRSFRAGVPITPLPALPTRKREESHARLADAVANVEAITAAWRWYAWARLRVGVDAADAHAGVRRSFMAFGSPASKDRRHLVSVLEELESQLLPAEMLAAILSHVSDVDWTEAGGSIIHATPGSRAATLRAFAACSRSANALVSQLWTRVRFPAAKLELSLLVSSDYAMPMPRVQEVIMPAQQWGECDWCVALEFLDAHQVAARPSLDVELHLTPRSEIPTSIADVPLPAPTRLCIVVSAANTRRGGNTTPTATVRALDSVFSLGSVQELVLAGAVRKLPADSFGPLRDVYARQGRDEKTLTRLLLADRHNPLSTALIHLDNNDEFTSPFSPALLAVVTAARGIVATGENRDQVEIVIDALAEASLLSLISRADWFLYNDADDERTRVIPGAKFTPFDLQESYDTFVRSEDNDDQGEFFDAWVKPHYPSLYPDYKPDD